LNRAARYAEADDALGKASELFESRLDKTGRAFVMMLLSRSWIYFTQDRFDEARACIVDMRRLNDGTTNLDIMANSFVVLGEIEFATGHFELAAECCERALKYGTMSPRIAMAARENLPCYRLAMSDFAAADAAARDAIQRGMAIGYPRIALSVLPLAAVAAARKHATLAARMCGYIDAYQNRSDLARQRSQQSTYSLLIHWLGEQLTVDELTRHRDAGSLLDDFEAVDEILALPASEALDS
jgi:tetratricopeptide (TPR) repeat protein